MHPYHHAISSVRKFGGVIDDYIAIHEWFDASKEHYADFRHRALRHHAQGIFECSRVFGPLLSIRCNDVDIYVPVRAVGEQHVMEDLGRIPTVQDWLQQIQVQPWMTKVAMKSAQLTGQIQDTPCSS
jgi:hypothetical protein